MVVYLKNKLHLCKNEKIGVVMCIDTEEKFVNNFINSSYRDRILFELKSSKKRLNALMRFSHNIDNLIKKDALYSRGKHFDEIKLKSFLTDQEFYVISFKFLDGIIMNIREVLDYINNEYSPVIVCGNNIAIIKKEFEHGDDNFYLLKDFYS